MTKAKFNVGDLVTDIYGDGTQIVVTAVHPRLMGGISVFGYDGVVVKSKDENFRKTTLVENFHTMDFELKKARADV